MYSKGLLYVRIRNKKIVDQLLYLLDDWDNDSVFSYKELLFRDSYGTVATFDLMHVDSHPEGGYGMYGSYMEYVRATDSQIMSLLNFWNTTRSFENWINKMQNCEGLLESEKKRLVTLTMQSKYYGT